ncbi:hypothetical protein [Streptomyces sp. NBC_00470]|uniref:hypothetical protein n=1 Tax=Streptomyces sp. NBC_00470 TaxID=2975753 RepID=UPI002F91660C
MPGDDVLNHPTVRACVDEIVANQGGLLTSGIGMGRSEALVAAGVKIAAATGKRLTVVREEPFREATARLVAELGLAEHKFLSLGEAAAWPTGFDLQGVLAIDTAALHDRPTTAEALRAAAREAARSGHLIVARLDLGEQALRANTLLERHLLPDTIVADHATERSALLSGAMARAAERLGMQSLDPSPWRPTGPAPIELVEPHLSAIEIPPPPGAEAGEWDPWLAAFGAGEIRQDGTFAGGRLDTFIAQKASAFKRLLAEGEDPIVLDDAERDELQNLLTASQERRQESIDVLELRPPDSGRSAAADRETPPLPHARPEHRPEQGPAAGRPPGLGIA